MSDAPPVVRLAGLDYADLDAEAAAALIAARPAGALFAYVATPNADHLVRLSRRPELLPLYEGAWLRILDSRVVARFGRLIGLRVPRVAPGSDVAELLLRRHLQPGERVTVIGMAAEHLPALRRAVPDADFAHHEPPMGLERNPEAMRAAVDFALVHPARYVFLAVGSPRQEMLGQALVAAGATGVGLCIGAGLEFVAGAKARAPRWMQKAGLEWLHRLASEPRRLARRYLIEGPAIFAILWRARREGRPAPPA